MNDPHEVTVRVRTLDGQWETLGSGRFRGVVPEGIQYSFNTWGADTCSFTLRRDTTILHPDLTTWTPIEVEVAGVVAWDGRIKETPTNDGSEQIIGVQCEGWQYHLDDDVYSAVYIHTNLTDWVDHRSLVGANLGLHPQGYQVTSGEGAITLSMPNNSVFANNTGVAVTLDLGQGNSANTLSIDAMTSFNAGAILLYCMAHDVQDWNGGGREDFISGKALNDASWGGYGTQQTFTASVTNRHRYITLLLYSTVVGTSTADYFIKFTGLRVFGTSAYQSSGASVLKADTIIKDVLAHSSFLTDTSRISAGTFNIPEFMVSSYQSYREILSAVNAYENYDLYVESGPRVVFKPRPSAPVYEVGQWAGANFQDASANAGDEVFNRVLVQGTGPDGTGLTVERYASGVAGSMFSISNSPVLLNPSFDVNTTGWSGGAITRDTTTFHSSPASASVTGINTRVGDTTGTFKQGLTYRLVIYVRTSALASTNLAFGILNPSVPTLVIDGAQLFYSSPGGGSFVALSLDWTPTQTYTSGVQVAVNNQTSFVTYWWDTVLIFVTRATMVDRRGFRRTKILPVNAPITVTSGARIGDLYLATHRTQPFRGSLEATGVGGVRSVVGGQGYHPGHLVTNKLMRVNYVPDPDTGGIGRDGRVASIQYTHDSLTASVSLDENRAGLETLLGRLAVVVGQRPN